MARVIRRSGVQSLSSFVGINGSNTTVDSGRLLISLKPQAVREATIRFLAQSEGEKSGFKSIQRKSHSQLLELGWNITCQ